MMKSLRYLVCHSSPKSTTAVFTLTDMLRNVPNDIELPDVVPTDIAMLFQTSGSTGVPKCVAHRHSLVNFILNTLVSHDSYTPDDVSFCDSPFGWAGGFPFSVLAGQTRVTKSGFSPEPEDNTLFSIDVIRRENCTVLTGLPPSLYDLFKHKNRFQEFKLKSIIAGGQPIGEDLAICAGQLCEYFIPVYASTETIKLRGLSVTKPSEFNEFASGYTLPGVEVKIVDHDEAIVPINTRVEIYVRHPYMFKEYYNDPEKTAAVMTDDGWFKMDDFGRMNENGVLSVEGRKSNIIISGGMNIAPEILEAIMKTCPGIDNVVVVPVSDHVYYQVICACVIITPESNLTEAEILKFCQRNYNDKPRLFTVLPKFCLLLEKFPETNTGKTSRKELMQMAEKKFASLK